MAYVNKRPIPRERVVTTVDHINQTEVTFESVLNNTINESVVVQVGERLGLFTSEYDFGKYINDYMSRFPGFFDMGVGIYGKANYLDGLRVRWNYAKVKEYVIANVISIEPVTHEELVDFLDDSYEWNDLNEEERQSVNDIVLGYHIEESFSKWVALERQGFNIVILE